MRLKMRLKICIFFENAELNILKSWIHSVWIKMMKANGLEPNWTVKMDYFEQILWAEMDGHSTLNTLDSFVT